MRKYYIFAIQKDIYPLYIGREETLFLTLNRLRKTTKKMEGKSIYNSLCDPFMVDRLKDYFQKKYNTNENKHYYFVNKNKEQTYLLELNYSCLVILTNDNLPGVLDILSYYSPYLFVCDFENYDFFFLRDINIRFKYTFNSL